MRAFYHIPMNTPNTNFVFIVTILLSDFHCLFLLGSSYMSMETFSALKLAICPFDATVTSG